jgi:hypothetical protein
MAVRYRLTERDGQLFYGEQSLGPVPELGNYGNALLWSTDGDLELHAQRKRALGNKVTFFFRCVVCNAWLAGNTPWCSNDCRRVSRAADARTRRAKRSAARPPMTSLTAAAKLHPARG